MEQVVDDESQHEQAGQEHVPGGMAGNSWFLQAQADVLGLPVFLAEQSEATALGAAFLAGLHAGLRTGQDELRRLSGAGRRFEPRLSP